MEGVKNRDKKLAGKWRKMKMTNGRKEGGRTYKNMYKYQTKYEIREELQLILHDKTS